MKIMHEAQHRITQKRQIQTLKRKQNKKESNK